MPSAKGLEGEELWRRVGLDELRQTLVRVETLMRVFEKTLRSLPSCNECAKARLLEHLRASSTRLGTVITGLAILAESLSSALTAAEQAQDGLTRQPVQPCRCSANPCTCHV